MNNKQELNASRGNRGTYKTIPENIKASMEGKSMKSGYGVTYDMLRYLEIPYIGFDGQRHIGEMVVNKNIAEDVLDIFAELYEIKYPIERMELIDNYNANDYNSIEANNTSAFNVRGINGADPKTSKLSYHSYGYCIDINPQINPWIDKNTGKGYHSNASKYWDRSEENRNSLPTVEKEAFITKNTEIYNIFIKHGWTWLGEGAENGNFDTQHFEKRLT